MLPEKKIKLIQYNTNPDFIKIVSLIIFFCKRTMNHVLGEYSHEKDLVLLGKTSTRASLDSQPQVKPPPECPTQMKPSYLSVQPSWHHLSACTTK
jgi:hypothetical protein